MTLLRPRSCRARRAFAAGLIALGAAHARPATDPEMPGEILLKLRSAAALGPLLSKHRLSLVAQSGARPIYRVKVTGADIVRDKLGALGVEPDVLIAEANPLHSAPEARKNGAWAIGTPAAYAAQWAPQAIGLAAAHALSVGSGVRVAVLDTGVDRAHPALAGRLAAGRDFVDGDDDPSEAGTPADAGFGHGTHVAGLVALAAPGARIVPLRVLDAGGRGNAWALADAMLHAVDPDANPATDDGAHVINLSLGSTDRTKLLDTIAKLAACTAFDGAGDPAEDVSDAGYNDDRARCGVSSGAVVVAAAGNDGGTVRQYPAAEGAYGLLAVAASRSDGRLADFTNFGSWVHLAAPGEALTSTVPGGGYGTWSGTSMASPLVAGVAALVRAAEPALGPDAVARRLERAASPLCATALEQLDAAAALGSAPAPGACR